MSHQIALVKTFSSDSGGSFSGLSEAMEAINIRTAPGLEQIVALGGDDTSRMDCFEMSSSTVSSLCNYTNENENENDSKENTNDSKENERDTTSNEENARSSANGATASTTRKKIFAKQSSWKNNNNSNSVNSSSTPSREPKKPKPASSKLQHFRLRTRFHNNNHSKNDSDTSSASTTTTTTSVIEAAAGEPTKETTAPKELEEETETASDPSITLSSSSSTHSSSRKLFRDQMDIVAYQEWPVQRRLEQKYKYFFHKGNYYRCQQPLQRSPSSVCAGFSVETVATKLGRSPVVVSFDDLDVVHEPSISTPFSIKGRIQTGLLSNNSSKFNFDEEDSLSTSKTGQSYSMAESFLTAIQSIISCSNSSSPRCGASR